jgi:hypothetical protein
MLCSFCSFCPALGGSISVVSIISTTVASNTVAYFVSAGVQQDAILVLRDLYRKYHTVYITLLFA